MGAVLSDEQFMAEALREAARAQAIGEVPVGAVLRLGDEIIARGHNRKETRNDPTAHAEIEAIRSAAEALGSWRLLDTTLYVTLEPCVMCCGALVLARVGRLVYGARDPKAGGVDSLYNIPRDERLNHRLAVTGGVLGEQCSSILSEFFKVRRRASQAGDPADGLCGRAVGDPVGSNVDALLDASESDTPK